MNNLIQKIAKKSNHKTYKHVSIITKGGAIQSVGYNRDLFHAEMVALGKIWPNKRAKTTVISIRVSRTGFANARPCHNCMKTLIFNGVKKITYTDKDGNWVSERI